MNRRAPIAWALFAVLLSGLNGCYEPECPSESFVVEENGSCSGSPQRLTLSSYNCRVNIYADAGTTGLPPQGALAQEPAPLRRGGFILYTPWHSSEPFRLCRARRVDFRLEVSCVDASGAETCQAILTEPEP